MPPHTSAPAAYPIGTPGQPWGEAKRAQWRARQVRHRRYDADVLPRIEALAARFERIAYGELGYTGETYPLYALARRPSAPSLLATLAQAHAAAAQG